MKFSIMFEDEVVIDVCIEDEKLIYVKKYIQHPGKQPFYGGEITIDRIYDFIKSRCFSFERPDKREILTYLGLNEYNPIEIVKRTHGHFWDDAIWIRFEDESLTWNEVKHGTC